MSFSHIDFLLPEPQHAVDRTTQTLRYSTPEEALSHFKKNYPKDRLWQLAVDGALYSPWECAYQARHGAGYNSHLKERKRPESGWRSYELREPGSLAAFFRGLKRAMQDIEGKTITQDQIKWVDALYHDKLLPKKFRTKLLDELETLVSMKTGKPIKTVNKKDPSGFGLGGGSAYFHNQRFWLYEGMTLSYQIMYLWKPCSNISVVVALNSGVYTKDPKAPIRNHIQYLALDIYKKIIESDHQLICND